MQQHKNHKLSQKQTLLHKLTTMNSQLMNKYNNHIDTQITCHNTLFILDWDDTLFPTTWIRENIPNFIGSNSGNIHDRYIEHFKPLDRALKSLLLKIQKMGKVIIVTNADKRWVKDSSIIMPETSYLIFKKDIEVYSARSLYNKKTSDVWEWKRRTFQDIIDREFEKKKLMNVISIGDADYERQALVSLTQSNFDTIKYLKSFQLLSSPTYEQLIEQIELLDIYIHKFWDLHKQICKTFKIHTEVK